MEHKKYNNLDALRAGAAISIIIMHVYWNCGYKIWGGVTNSPGGYFINHVVACFALYTRLFMMISGFSMCCGYYEKFKNNEISLDTYFKRRYSKILPFFLLLTLLDLLSAVTVSHDFSISRLYEAFTNATLIFGFIPQTGMTVVGVGWTLGVIFGFYMLFPFFVWLLWNKKRAWFTLVITLLLAFLCEEYFLLDGSPAQITVRYLWCFVAGGILYLYRDTISNFLARCRRGRILGYIIIAAGLVLVYITPVFKTGAAYDSLINNLKNLVGFSLVLAGALMPESRLLYNPVSRFISKISLEIYLAHMFIFRILEKMGLIKIFDNEFCSYIAACVFVLGGVILFAFVYKVIEKLITKQISSVFSGLKK